MLSTHILADVERICDHVAVLNNGRLALCGTLSEIKAKHKADSLFIEFVTSADKDKFIALFDMTNYAQTETSVTIHTGNIAATQTAVIELIAKEKLLPQKLEVAEPTIESLFLEVVK